MNGKQLRGRTLLKRYLKLKDGLCFNIEEEHLLISLGYIHPPNHVYSVLKYYKKGNGQIQRTLLGRGVTDFVDSLPLLLEKHPKYLEYSPTYDCELLCIPNNDITHIYDGLKRYREISENPRNKFEQAAARLRIILIDLGLPEESIHLRGSILYSQPREDSDLDISIEGKKIFKRYLEVIHQAPGVSVMPPSEVERNVNLLAGVCPLSKDHITFNIRRRKTKLTYGNIPVSVKCIRSDYEIRNEVPVFSSIKARNLNPTRITGIIKDASASCCYPVEYKISAKNNQGYEVTTIYCFESLFAEFLQIGEYFEAYGILQEILIKDNPKTYRLILGTRELAGKEYLRRISKRQS